jgi:hypothetical protein
VLRGSPVLVLLAFLLLLLRRAQFARPVAMAKLFDAVLAKPRLFRSRSALAAQAAGLYRLHPHRGGGDPGCRWDGSAFGSSEFTSESPEVASSLLRNSRHPVVCGSGRQLPLSVG